MRLTRGVFSNVVTFHSFCAFDGSSRGNSLMSILAPAGTLSPNGASDSTGMFPRLTVSLREMRVTVYWDFRRGSSQQGNALLVETTMRGF